jgi:hypothetical protein
MRRRLEEPVTKTREDVGVAFRRSRGPRSRLQRAFWLTNGPSRSTVEPRSRGYLGNVGWSLPVDKR